MNDGAQYLGLDVGTQGTKALVIDADGRVLARASRTYGLLPGLPPGAAEQHPHTWREAVRGCCAELLADPRVARERIAALGVSGQQHGCVLVDERGEVLRPAKLWCDTSTAAEAAELRVPAGFTASKVLWTARHEPELWARTAHVLLPHDWIDLELTGELVAEAGDASGTGWFDVRARTWDLAAAARVDPELPARLPRLVAAGAPAGRLHARGAALTGLAEGTLVASGGGDNMCSAIGAGAVEPGSGVLSLGTSATIFGCASKPVHDPSELVAPFCDSTGHWLPLLCVMNATGVLEEVRAAFGASHGELTRAASEVPLGSHGATFVPFLQGERVPNLPLSTASLHGLRAGSLQRGVLYRAALEGVALNLAWGLERMRAVGFAARELRLVGGGAKNALWQEILADALEAAILPLDEPETGALGAALQALWTDGRTRDAGLTCAAAVAGRTARPVGFVEPRAEHAAAWREMRARYAERIAALS
ncbi:MAG: xylulokinase [Planctomycetota bacterium]|nr:MAG: xylulokinase [Planctomycetota bacterium]